VNELDRARSRILHLLVYLLRKASCSSVREERAFALISFVFRRAFELRLFVVMMRRTEIAAQAG
jgi:hypothetical protein